MPFKSKDSKGVLSSNIDLRPRQYQDESFTGFCFWESLDVCPFMALIPRAIFSFMLADVFIGIGF